MVVEAGDSKGRSIYHTNVFMSIGTDFVVVCMDAVTRQEDKKHMEDKFKDSGK